MTVIPILSSVTLKQTVSMTFRVLPAILILLLVNHCYADTAPPPLPPRTGQDVVNESDETPGGDDMSFIAGLPTEITSDTMDFDIEQKTATFIGNVNVEDERISLASDKMLVQFSDDDKLAFIEMMGNVVVTSDSSDQARSGKAKYDFEAGLIVLSEKPELIKGRCQIVGAKEIHFIKEENVFRTKGRTTIICEQDKSQSDLFEVFGGDSVEPDNDDNVSDELNDDN